MIPSRSSKLLPLIMADKPSLNGKKPFYNILEPWDDPKWFVGKLRTSGVWKAFSSYVFPTPETHETDYSVVYGPFCSKKGAVWYERNPNNTCPHVDAVEACARVEEAANKKREQLEKSLKK